MRSYEPGIFCIGCGTPITLSVGHSSFDWGCETTGCAPHRVLPFYGDFKYIHDLIGDALMEWGGEMWMKDEEAAGRGK